MAHSGSHRMKILARTDCRSPVGTGRLLVRHKNETFIMIKTKRASETDSSSPRIIAFDDEREKSKDKDDDYQHVRRPISLSRLGCVVQAIERARHRSIHFKFLLRNQTRESLVLSVPCISCSRSRTDMIQDDPKRVSTESRMYIAYFQEK